MARAILRGTIHTNQKHFPLLFTPLAWSSSVSPLSLAPFFCGTNAVALSVADHSTIPPLAQKDVRGRGAKRKHTSDRDEVSVGDGTAATTPPNRGAVPRSDTMMTTAAVAGVAAIGLMAVMATMQGGGGPHSASGGVDHRCHSGTSRGSGLWSGGAARPRFTYGYPPNRF